MKSKLAFLASFILFFSFATLAIENDRIAKAIEKDPAKTFLVYKFEMKEEIAPPALFKLQKAFKEADSLKVDFILIHMNTYGGRVDIADSIRTRIMQSKIPVMVFVDNNAASAGALISIASDRIYMRPGSNIGAATVVDQTGEVVADKYQSYMRSMMRSTAEAKGRDPEIAQAMVDPSIFIPGIIDEGKVLTFTASEAEKHGFSEGTAETISEVLTIAGIENHTIVEQKLSLLDHIISFLLSPIVSGLLIMLILGGIYFEFQTPGVGFPIFVSIVAATLFFGPSYLEGLASNWEIALFVIGVVLLGIEIFVIPGFGVAGILGVSFMVISLVMAMLENDGFNFSGVPTQEIIVAFSVVIIALFLSVVGSIWLTKKLFTQTKRFSGFALNTEQLKKDGYTSAVSEITALVGQSGVAFTVLRPSGKVEINDNVYDATALSGFIDKGQKVTVVKYETAQVFVVKNE